MKRTMKFFFALAAFFLIVQLNAQVRVNPKVGVNVSAVEATLNDINTEARVGWNAGLDIRAGEGFLFFNPGVHYYSYTANLVEDVDNAQDFKFEDETTIQAIKAPLNLGLNLTGDGGLLALHAKGGISPTYVLGVKETPNFAFDKGDLNRFTLGANVGAGLDVLFLTIDANYEIGLTDFFKDVDGRNNVLTLSVGIKF